MSTVDRLVVLVLGLLLLAGGGLLVVEVVQAESSQTPLVDWPAAVHALRTTDFDNGIAMAAFAMALILGVLLLVAAVRRRPPRRVALQDHQGSGGWWLRRSSLERFLARMVLQRTAATSTTVRVRPAHRLEAEVIPHPGAAELHSSDVTADEVEACLVHSLEALKLAEPMPVRVRLAGAGRVRDGRS